MGGAGEGGDEHSLLRLPSLSFLIQATQPITLKEKLQSAQWLAVVTTLSAIKHFIGLHLLSENEIPLKHCIELKKMLKT